MTDVELNLGALSLAKSRVENALDTFQGVDRVGEDLAELTGDRRLAGRVRDFAGNWDHNRAKLEEQLVGVRDWLQAIDDTMSDLDQAMADGVDVQETAP